MEIKTNMETVTAGQIVYDAQQEIPFETEILLADYLPQVHKVIKCFAQAIVLQKQISASKITLEGYLRCEVFYQAEENAALCQTEQKVPFTRHLELKEDAAPVVSVETAGKPSYINARAVSQNRITVRGGYLLSVRAYGVKSYDFIASCGETLQEKQVSLTAASLCAQQEKVLTLQVPLPFEQPPKTILSVNAVCPHIDTQIVDGKAVAAGRVQIEVAYAPENGLPQLLQCDADFNEVVQFDNLQAGSDVCNAFFQMFGSTVQQAEAEDGAQYQLSLSGGLSVDVYRTVTQKAVLDAYSAEKEISVQPQQITLQQICETAAQTCVCRVEDETVQPAGTIVFVKASAAAPELVQYDNSKVLKGSVSVYVFVRSENDELDCFEKNAEYAVACNSSAVRLAEAHTAVLNVKAEKQQNQLRADVSLAVSGILFTEQTYTCLLSIEEKGEWAAPDADIAMLIYYAQDGETVFDIAKRYHVPMQLVREANMLTQETLAAGPVTIPVCSNGRE